MDRLTEEQFKDGLKKFADRCEMLLEHDPMKGAEASEQILTWRLLYDIKVAIEKLHEASRRPDPRLRD